MYHSRMLEEQLLLHVALPVPLMCCFDYLPPETAPIPEQVIGCRLRVPFGNRELFGVVVNATSCSVAPPSRVRHALAWVDTFPLLSDELLRSVQLLARYTHSPMGEVIATALLGTLRQGAALPDTTEYQWALPPEGVLQRARLRAGGLPARCVAALANGPRTAAELDILCPEWKKVSKELVKRGCIAQVPQEKTPKVCTLKADIVPNHEQRQAIDTLQSCNGFAVYLLDGVTGSGKTEVYLHAIAQCIARQQQVLLLVPEIGLTPQILQRLQKRLGIDIDVIHSQLSDTARTCAWARAWRGEASLIVGTRSAVFMPLPHAGLIIIDEEHDSSYKQQDGVRYNARDFALMRAKHLQIPVVLGSATPSLESISNMHAGRYQLLRLTRRAGSARPPTVRIIDMRKRLLLDGLCTDVLDAIGATLEKNQQVLVFKNRRGYAPALLCHDCGWTALCPRCSTKERGTALTLHTGKGLHRLHCHHCGTQKPVVTSCPGCGNTNLVASGVGTERLEERLSAHFPNYPVLRLDRSSTHHGSALGKQLNQLGRKPGILVGTQLLTKGHDLPELTLVVVVGIDEGLFSADFRASEKLSQLLIQVAGRAGRAADKGEVWLQTHYPDHPLLETLVHGGYHAFAEAELAQRHGVGFPPFTYLALLRAEAKHAQTAPLFLKTVRSLCRLEHKIVECFGPMPAPMPRRAGYLRSQLIWNATDRQALHRMLSSVVPQIYAEPLARRVRWSLDIDPIDLY